MRITNSMMVNNLLKNLYKNYTKMDKAQQMLASQKKFLRPSDDPIGVTRSLRLTTELLNMYQYSRNVDDSDSWLQSSEQVIKNMMEVMQRVRELTAQASNETYSPEDRKKIADEITELKNQLIGLGNTAYAGSYLFSGYKTDKALFNLDGTYNLDGGILSINEDIFVNVGISDRMSINYVGQKIFGHMATTTYDEYVLKSNGNFVGAKLDSTNNGFIINYNGTNYTITMDIKEYNSFEGGSFVRDLNEAIVGAIPDVSPAPELKDVVKASLENGEIVFRGAREFEIISTGTTMNIKDTMGIDFDKGAELTKIIVSDINDIDNPISHGDEEYRLKAASSFTGVASGDEFIIYYGDYTYKVIMDRDYGADEDKEFIYDFNKKLSEDSDLKKLKGHLKLYEKDGMFAISADKKFRIDSGYFDKLGFEDNIGGASGLKSIKIAHSMQGGEINLIDNPITITDDVNDKIYLTYGGKGYTIDLHNDSTPKVYDGTSNTFDDLVNDIQSAINNTDLKGYISVTGNNGKIQFSGDSEFKHTYGIAGDFDGISDLSTDPLTIDGSNDRFDIKLGSGSPVTMKIDQGTYTTLDDFTNAIQNSIDGDMYIRGRVTVSNDGTNITFYSDLPITISQTSGSGLLNSATSSDSDLMEAFSFNTAKQSSKIDKKVESGSATQLIGMLDQLILDLNNSDTEEINKALKRLDANINNLNAVRAEMGVKSNRLELTKNRIEDDNVNLRELLSKNEDVDIAEMIMKLQMDTNVYNAALSVGSKIITLSLVDFLR